MPVPRKPNRQPSQNFADIIGRRAQEVRAQPHGQDILRMQSPEQIAEVWNNSPVAMMGVGNLTNITGRGLPQILSKATKSYAQTTPTPANPRQIQGVKWEQILEQPKIAPNRLLQDFTKLPPKKVGTLTQKLSKNRLKLEPFVERSEDRMARRLGIEENRLLPEGVQSAGDEYGMFRIMHRPLLSDEYIPVATIRTITTPSGVRHFVIDQGMFHDLTRAGLKKNSPAGKGTTASETLEELIDKLIESLR